MQRKENFKRKRFRNWSLRKKRTNLNQLKKKERGFSKKGDLEKHRLKHKQKPQNKRKKQKENKIIKKPKILLKCVVSVNSWKIRFSTKKNVMRSLKRLLSKSWQTVKPHLTLKSLQGRKKLLNNLNRRKKILKRMVT